MENGAEMGPRGHLGAKGSQEGKKAQKLGLVNPVWGTIWAPFWDLEAFFSETFFNVFLGCVFFAPNVFWDVSFSLPGRLLGAKGAQKAPKMEPKGAPKSIEKIMDFLIGKSIHFCEKWSPRGAPRALQK